MSENVKNDVEELKSCPFCNGKAEYDNDTGPRDDYFIEFIVCNGCGAKVYGRNCYEKWNTRKTRTEK